MKVPDGVFAGLLVLAVLSSCNCGGEGTPNKPKIRTGDLTVAGLSLSNQTVSPSSRNVPILRLQMRTNQTTVVVQSVTFKADGTGDDAADVDYVKLWLDANNNGQADGGEPLLGSGAYATDNGVVTIFVNRTVLSNTTESWLVTYDFNAGAGGTFTAVIQNAQTDVMATVGGVATQPVGGTIAGATITVAAPTAAPVVLFAELRENPTTQNEQGDAGEKVVVTFDKDVVVNGSPDPNAVFNLPVSDDSFGTGATLSAGPKTNQVTITLGSGCVITAAGLFDAGNTNRGDPSGIDISASIPTDAIEDAAGSDAQPSTPVDIAGSYIPGQTVVGFAINALEPLGQQWGNVVVQYVVACDNPSSSLSVVVEYYDGGSWRTATSAAGSDPLTNFAASDKGDLRIFVWDSYADMPDAGKTSDYDKVMLRFTITDGVDSKQDTTEVMLDNKPQVICGADQVVNVGELVFVDAGRSVDPAGSTVTHTFTLKSQPSGSTATLLTIDYLASFTADVAGDYEVEVRVEAGGRTSDPLTVKITAVKSRNVIGKLHLGRLNGAIPSNLPPAKPHELALDPANDVGYYTAQFNLLGYLDLSKTPAPQIHSTPCSDAIMLSFNYSGKSYSSPVFPEDVYVNRNTHKALCHLSDYGFMNPPDFSVLALFVYDGAKLQHIGSGAPITVGVTLFAGLTHSALAHGLCSFVRNWQGAGGTVTNDVAYAGSDETLIEYGSVDTTDPNNPIKILSWTDGVGKILVKRVGCEAQDHGNGLNAWACVEDTPQNGVAIFNIDDVGDGSGTKGLNTITAITWAGGWNADDIPKDIWVDNTNGKVWVAFQRQSENGGVCVIDCASQQVEVRYQIPLATDDASPWRLLTLQHDNILLLTDADYDRVFVLRVDDWAAPTSVSLDYAIKVSKPYDLEYDTPRDRVLVTSPGNSEIYALAGPWTPDVDVVKSKEKISSFAVAQHPRKAEIYVVYCEGTGAGSAIRFTKSTDGGLTWSSPVELSKAPHNYVSAPDIAVDHIGNITVVWQSDGGQSADGVYLTRSSDGGNTWEAPIRCEPNGAPPNYSRREPAVAVDAAGNIIIAYIVDDGSGNAQAAVMKSVGAQSWLYWGAGTDNAVSGATDCRAPDVVVVPDANEPLGKIVVGWHQGTANSAFCSCSVGNRGWQPTGGAEAKVNHTGGNATDGAVFVNGSLQPRFCWSDDTNAAPNHDVYFGDGSSDVLIDSTNGSDRAKVRLAFATGSDYVYAAYIVNDRFIYWATSDNAGSSWTVEPLLLTDAARSQVVPLTNRTMTRMVLWLEQLPSGGSAIKFSRFR